MRAIFSKNEKWDIIIWAIILIGIYLLLKYDPLNQIHAQEIEIQKNLEGIIVKDGKLTRRIDCIVYMDVEQKLEDFKSKLQKRLIENRKEFAKEWGNKFAEETALNMGLDKTKRTADENIDIYIKLLREGSLNSEDFKWLVKGQYELEEMRKLTKGKINTHGIENRGKDSFFEDARRYYRLYQEGKLTHQEQRLLRQTRSDYRLKYKK